MYNRDAEKFKTVTFIYFTKIRLYPRITKIWYLASRLLVVQIAIRVAKTQTNN